jgi:hypothetical protein
LSTGFDSVAILISPEGANENLKQATRMYLPSLNGFQLLLIA